MKCSIEAPLVTHLDVDDGLDAEPPKLADGRGDVGTVGAGHGQQVVRHPMTARRIFMTLEHM